MNDTQEREKLFREFFGGDDGDFVTRFESFQALMVQSLKFLTRNYPIVQAGIPLKVFRPGSRRRSA